MSAWWLGVAAPKANETPVMSRIHRSLERMSEFYRTSCFLPLRTGRFGAHGILRSIAPETQKRWIVAIDGPAGAGKSTIARAIAQRLGFTYIDSGAMYRAVALWALRVGVDLDDLHRLEQLAKEARVEFTAGETTVRLNGEDVTAQIREPRVSEAASKVSLAPGVRRAMREEQRRIAAAQSVVMEGRDIGTVVFPDAQVKVYLDAAPEVRAGRRAAQLGAAAGEVAREMAERD